jgi:hypothetical protein
MIIRLSMQDILTKYCGDDSGLLTFREFMIMIVDWNKQVDT